jgi:D-alanyl-D-alanine carboxypeptidase/D-alanyl-D-alanine-endopeptidase (penicillin-binding protein 4)
MIFRGIAALGILLAGLSLPLPHALGGTTALQPAPADLAARLDLLLADRRLADVQVGVAVRDASSGAVLYERSGTARLIPGSNQKLLIATAAFATLGPEYRFRTALLSSGRQQGQTLEGNLYVKGTGDPTMLPQRWDELASALANLGITRVRGRLVFDDTWFDDVRLGPDWAWDDESFGFAAQVSALTVSPDEDFDAGSVLVELQPGNGPGAPVQMTLTPQTAYVRITNQVITGEPGSELRVLVERVHGTNAIILTGNLPADATTVRRLISVWEPTAYAADIFRAALERRGIRVDNPTAFGTAPLSAREVAALESMPLSQLAIPFLKLSNNGIAEILVKTLGRHVYGEGSWQIGMQVVAEYLARVGLDPATLRLRDGSGLSRLNLVSARDMTALLVAARREAWFQQFYDALPIAGVADRLTGGSLRFRMVGTPAERNVRAKTGTLTGVSTLSGYATGQGGALLAFSILINNFIGAAPRDLEDAIAVALVGPVPPPVPQGATNVTLPVSFSNSHTRGSPPLTFIPMRGLARPSNIQNPGSSR